MRLLNVRLDEEDAKLVRGLRERGISISYVVRKAIRAEAGRHPSTDAVDTDALLAEMQTRYPLSSERPAVRLGTASDRRQLQKLIRAKLRRRA